MDKNTQEHVSFNLQEADHALDEAMNRLRKCIYAMKLENKTMAELLDQQNHIGYSLVGDLATIQAVRNDIAYFMKQERK